MQSGEFRHFCGDGREQLALAGMPRAGLCVPDEAATRPTPPPVGGRWSRTICSTAPSSTLSLSMANFGTLEALSALASDPQIEGAPNLVRSEGPSRVRNVSRA